MRHSNSGIGNYTFTAFDKKIILGFPGLICINDSFTFTPA
jgi:hypothetical protein